MRERLASHVQCLSTCVACCRPQLAAGCAFKSIEPIGGAVHDYASFLAKSSARRCVYRLSISSVLCPMMEATSITLRLRSNKRLAASWRRSCQRVPTTLARGVDLFLLPNPQRWKRALAREWFGKFLVDRTWRSYSTYLCAAPANGSDYWVLPVRVQVRWVSFPPPRCALAVHAHKEGRCCHFARHCTVSSAHR